MLGRQKRRLLDSSRAHISSFSILKTQVTHSSWLSRSHGSCSALSPRTAPDCSPVGAPSLTHSLPSPGKAFRDPAPLLALGWKSPEGKEEPELLSVREGSPAPTQSRGRTQATLPHGHLQERQGCSLQKASLLGSPLLASNGATCLGPQVLCPMYPQSPQSSSGGHKTLEASHCCMAQGRGWGLGPPRRHPGELGIQWECPHSAHQELETPHVFLPTHPFFLTLSSPSISPPSGTFQGKPSGSSASLYLWEGELGSPAWRGFALGRPCRRRPGGGRAGPPQVPETHQAWGFLFTSPRWRLHWEWGLRW